MSFVEDHSREIGIAALGFGLSYLLYKVEPFMGTVIASFVFMYLSSILVPLGESEEPFLLLANS